MANNITYADKTYLNENADVPAINKVRDVDMNEIKKVVNETVLELLLGVSTDTWSSSGTYAIGDVVIYDFLLYANLTGTNTATTPDQDTTNWEQTTILTN